MLSKCGGHMANFWKDNVSRVWVETGLQKKHMSKIVKGRGFQPRIAYGKNDVDGGGEYFALVYITSNVSQETIDMGSNEEYLADVRRVAKIKDNFGPLQWVRG
ncbi:hypothetical protein C8R42DRAFT_723222 [Lentinula raphanica]|nr:hypothetical protein C8R42DRAFT_723222 [Lentinula raphanica]